MAMYHHTIFGYKRFRDSEDATRTNINGNFERLPWPWSSALPSNIFVGLFWLTTICHQSKFGSKKNNHEFRRYSRKSYFHYISPHCGLDNDNLSSSSFFFFCRIFITSALIVALTMTAFLLLPFSSSSFFGGWVGVGVVCCCLSVAHATPPRDDAPAKNQAWLQNTERIRGYVLVKASTYGETVGQKGRRTRWFHYEPPILSPTLLREV